MTASEIAPQLVGNLERGAEDIFLIDCPFCGNQSYYDQGFTCGCEWCEKEIAIFSDDSYTLVDYWESIGPWTDMP